MNKNRLHCVASGDFDEWIILLLAVSGESEKEFFGSLQRESSARALEMTARPIMKRLASMAYCSDHLAA
jgi:hypothetical protein